MMPAFGYAVASMPAPIGALPMGIVDVTGALVPLAWALGLAAVVGFAVAWAGRRRPVRIVESPRLIPAGPVAQEPLAA